MDGVAVDASLASNPGPHWLRDIVPKFGLRIKFIMLYAPYIFSVRQVTSRFYVVIIS